MGYKRLVIFVEGGDDERFVTGTIKPELEKLYDFVEMVRYAQEQDEKIRKYLISIASMKADYIYMKDINNSPCVADKKGEIKRKLKNISDGNMVIVIKEIESWYLAGLDSEACKELDVPDYSTTKNIDKEQFKGLKPKRFVSNMDFMVEILKYFSIETAKKKNKSFGYFWQKYCQGAH